MANFKIGDLIVLKSGSPAMTVDGVNVNGGKIHAVWFAGAKHESAYFHPEALEPAPAKADKK